MLASMVVILSSLMAVSGHEYYNGACPVFTPMPGLDWRVFQGEWKVVFKMNSRSSYTFSEVGNTWWDLIILLSAHTNL